MELVAVSFDFGADKEAVTVAKIEDVGDAAAASGVDAPAGFGGVINAGGVLAPDGVAVVGGKARMAPVMSAA